MNLARQPSRTVNRRNYSQPLFTMPNIRPDRMNRRILAQLPPNQQIAINNLGHSDLMNHLDSFLAALLTNTLAILDVMPFTRTKPRHPAIMGTLGRLGAQQGTPNTLLRGLSSGHLPDLQSLSSLETQHLHRPAQSGKST
jgi:hypothetical protein